MKSDEANKKPENSPCINVGITGFGLSGEFFHAPFIQNHPGFHLQTIISSGEKAGKLYPKVNIQKDFSALLNNSSIQLIVICTPHKFHFEQASLAMQAGKDVVIEKPVAMSSMEIKSLMHTSAKTGRHFFPFQNRRFDGDFITLRSLIDKGLIGKVVSFESSMDRYNPVISRAGWRYMETDGGGTLFDLGPHLIDQTISLFGKPDSVWCKLYIQRPESKVADGFDLKLFYAGVTASLRAGVMVLEPGPRFQLHGTQGSYIKYGIDPQEGKLRKGIQPSAKGFGNEPKRNFGTLRSLNFNDNKKTSWPTNPGYYLGFYNNIFECLIHDALPEISPMDALLNLLVIEAAIRSNAEERNIRME